MYMLWGKKRHSFRASQLRSYRIIISTLPVFPLHKIRQSIGPIPRCGPAWASRFPSWECLESQFLPSPHPSRSRRRADHEHRWNGPIFSWWHWESMDGWLSSQKEWTSYVFPGCYFDDIYLKYFQVNPSNYNPFGAWYFWEHLHRKPPVSFHPKSSKSMILATMSAYRHLSQNFFWSLQESPVSLYIESSVHDVFQW